MSTIPSMLTPGRIWAEHQYRKQTRNLPSIPRRPSRSLPADPRAKDGARAMLEEIEQDGMPSEMTCLSCPETAIRHDDGVYRCHQGHGQRMADYVDGLTRLAGQ